MPQGTTISISPHIRVVATVLKISGQWTLLLSLLPEAQVKERFMGSDILKTIELGQKEEPVSNIAGATLLSSDLERQRQQLWVSQ